MGIIIADPGIIIADPFGPRAAPPPPPRKWFIERRDELRTSIFPTLRSYFVPKAPPIDDPIADGWFR